MKVLIGSMLTLMKVGALAAAVVAALSLAQQPSAESASNTQVIFSYSAEAPIPVGAIIMNPDGVPRDIYVWAVDVKEPTGVSGFNIAVEFDESYITATPASGDINGIGDITWLRSTGRQGACIPDLILQPGKIIGLCSTLTPPPPLGPTGTGLIGHIVLTPGSEAAPTSQLTLVTPAFGVQGTFLLDTPVDPDDIQPLPVDLVSTVVVFLGCADNTPPPNGDGIVDLPNDILGVILRFGMTESNAEWDPLFDINNDGFIDLPNDILGTILQFLLPCTHS